MISSRSYTQSYNGYTNEIITPISVSSLIRFKPGIIDLSKYEKSIINGRALWDTGASNSVITDNFAKKLGLFSIKPVNVVYGGNTKTENSYLVNLYLPNKIIIPEVFVTGCDDHTKFDVIIGMDIIRRCDFAISSYGGKMKFSIDYPSKRIIDFVEEEKKKHTPIIAEKKTGRNDPCPCNSGKKFKNCCAN